MHAAEHRSPWLARIRGSRTAAGVLLAVLAMSGCGSVTRPDLNWMYTTHNSEVRQPPLVIIPGLMGTRLLDAESGKEVWPGSALRLLFSDYDALAMPNGSASIEPAALVAGGLTDRAAGRDFYSSILATLEHSAGYQLAIPGQPLTESPRTYYVFTYDWRQDLQETAAALFAFIESIRTQHGDPDLKVDIVAHSMGGLIARYMIRYGDADVLDGNDLVPTMAGSDRVRRVILLGTPNLGSVDAIRALIAGRSLGFGRIAPETLVTMPSMVQLFPHAITDWIVTAAGKPLERDQFDVGIWRRFEWAIFDPRFIDSLAETSGSRETALAEVEELASDFEQNLERARRFVWSLTVPTDSPAELIVFGGDCAYTPARLLVEDIGDESFVRLWPDEILAPLPDVDYHRLMLEPGDGIVTKSSLLARTNVDPTIPRHRYAHFPLDYAFLLCERHDRLSANENFQDNLLDALLRPDG